MNGTNILYDILNDNDKRLIDVSESRNMFVSSEYSHKAIYKQTWRSPDGESKDQIDSVLIDKRR